MQRLCAAGRGRVQDERDRPVVRQLDQHIGAEYALFNRHTVRAQGIAQIGDKRRSDLRPRRPREIRATSFARIAEERELADNQRSPADIQQRAIEVRRGIERREDAQAGDLLRHPFRRFARIVMRNAHQQHHAAPNGTNDLPPYRDRGMFDALQDNTHERKGYTVRRRVESRRHT